MRRPLWGLRSVLGVLMFFATTPSPLAAGFAASLGHPARRRLYAQTGNPAAQFLEKALAASRAVGTHDHDITQDDKQFTLKLDVPGLAKEHLSIRMEGAIVRIESKQDAPRRYRAAYEFGQDIDMAASSATLEHGVLTLTLAKVVPVRAQAELAIS